MSDFPSLSDLAGHSDDNKKDNTPSTPNSQSVPVTVSGVAGAFSKRMDEIKHNERERESVGFAQQIGFPHINLEKFPVSLESLRQVPLEIAQQRGVVCFYSTPEEIRIGALDPTMKEVQDLLEERKIHNHVEGVLYVISENSLDRVLKLYETLPTVKPVTKDIEIKVADLEAVQADISDFDSLQHMLERKTTTDIITIVLGAALKLNASDVHVEAEQDRIVVRFRLDGILHDAAELEKEVFDRLISRIKLTSMLKINVTDKPQDGRFTIKLPSGDVDVRVSTIPTVFGESIVMRLLAQNAEKIELADLGLRGRAYEIISQEILRPNGMVITTGPTGSGKTTTMYAVLRILNKPGVKIITLEDPVEYRMEGVNQSQIDMGKQYTFAKGLRSLLRQDPDIVMVGEIRDLETAEIAIQAALTGHLMLSTIHTNNAVGAVPRFLSMGVKPFLLAPALNCVMGQRLVRRVCSDCAQSVPLDSLESHVRERAQKALDDMPDAEKKNLESKEIKFPISKGCPKCNGIGYRGRIGIYEVFTVTPEIEQGILAGSVSEYDVAALTKEQGMITMVQDGILKAVDGITTLDEIFRVTE